MDMALARRIADVGSRTALDLGRLMEGVTEPQERRRMAEVIGRIVGLIYADLLRPVYKDFPELEPPQLKD